MFSGCGLYGAMLFGDRIKSFPKNLLNTKKMTDSLKHRGPNGGGFFDGGNVIFGHRRLSILDLSSCGNQPMRRDYLTIITNGEVYNYQEIRENLKNFGYQFTTNTDTEVILRCYQKYGSRCLKYFNGMFAIVIWDENKQELFFARDRMGIKPFYYYVNGEILIFASEVNTILQSGFVPKTVNLEYLKDLVLVSSMFNINNNTAIQSINSLPMGHYAKVKINGPMNIKQYWDLPSTKYINFDNEAQLIDRMDDLLNKSIQLRLISDAPVSAFLSGGIDSSLINTIACKHNTNKQLLAITTGYKKNHSNIETDALYYSSETKDDLYYSKILSKRLNGSLVHKIVYYDPKELLLGKIDSLIDFANISDDIRLLAVDNNYSYVKKNKCKVVLNGQGADELMAGYIGLPNFYEKIFDVQKPSINLIKNSLSSFALMDAQNLNPDVLNKRKELFHGICSFHNSLPGSNLEKIHRFLIYTQLKRILQFEDFLSMKNSIECRLPFLDYNIVEFSFMVNYNKHIQKHNRLGKLILRELSNKYLPSMLSARSKQPFPYIPKDLTYDSLLKIFKNNRSEILQCDLLGYLLNINIYKNHNKTLALRELWTIINIWRFESLLRNIV